ncbi:MAG: hypothetical protein JWL72_4661 [Ilumatobacteraceae bacterium]|nr:hypothetical protein [Ilumatobacteraceae bacterium]MCU1391323.1 hypothetical protein [Ilumatobacteraceae bacterium]
MNTSIATQPTPSSVQTRAETVPQQRLSRLFTVELRKTIDTRSGRTMLASVLLLSLAIAVWAAVKSFSTEVEFGELLEGIALPMTMLLPVVGVLAMTSEWSQRTALTTFTLSPRRTRVLLCKIGAALVIGVVMTAIAVALALIAYPIATSHNDVLHSNAGMGASIVSIFLAASLNILMGAAFGALLSISAAALVTYFAAPLLWSTLGTQLFGSSARWLDITDSIHRISTRELSGTWPQTITSIVVWIVVPTAVGLWVSSRREVK